MALRTSSSVCSSCATFCRGRPATLLWPSASVSVMSHLVNGDLVVFGMSATRRAARDARCAAVAAAEYSGRARGTDRLRLARRVRRPRDRVRAARDRGIETCLALGALAVAAIIAALLAA
jgi:hypothetical protein